jgi:hypothetical protein
MGVQDMYAYEFKLEWDPTYWIIQSYAVEKTWPTQVVILPDAYYDADIANQALGPSHYLSSYTQVVSALAPATGVTGDFKLATLTFHIHTDICYPQDVFDSSFEITNWKASDSCSGQILLCNPYNAEVEFVAATPDIKIVPNNETNWMVGPHEKFIKEIWVSDITKMKSLRFELRWNKWNANWTDPQHPDWNEMVNLVNYEFDPVNLPLDIIETMKLDGPAVVPDHPDQVAINVTIKIKCTAKPLRGTFRVLTLTFEKKDPWYCGYQPIYKFTQPHTWTPENATCKFWFEKGYFDVYCPGLEYIYFGLKGVMPTGVTEKKGGLVDSKTLFNGIGGPTKSYGTATYVDSDKAISGIGSVNLTTYTTGDVAAVGFAVPNIPLKDIVKLTFNYYHTWWPGPVGDWPGPRLAIGINGTTMDRILVSNPGAAWLGANIIGTHDATPGPWFSYVWDANVTRLLLGDMSGVTTAWPGVGPLAGGHLHPPYLADNANVTFIGIFMGPVLAPPPPGVGSAVVDLVKLEIYYPPTGNYWLTYDLEPPYKTSKWFDATLKALTCEYISNLYTFVPIPGDLNRDGVVDIVDVLIIASFYGKSGIPAKYYSLDHAISGDWDVDIFDIVIVTKNFGRSRP